MIRWSLKIRSNETNCKKTNLLIATYTQHTNSIEIFMTDTLIQLYRDNILMEIIFFEVHFTFTFSVMQKEQELSFFSSVCVFVVFVVFSFVHWADLIKRNRKKNDIKSLLHYIMRPIWFNKCMKMLILSRAHNTFYIFLFIAYRYLHILFFAMRIIVEITSKMLFFFLFCLFFRFFPKATTQSHKYKSDYEYRVGIVIGYDCSLCSRWSC